MTVIKADAERLTNVGFHSDGTVRAVSATPLEHDDDPDVPLFRQAMAGAHLPMAGTSTVVAELKECQRQSDRPVRRGDRLSVG